MTAVVIRGDARNLPLPDGSVDLIVTSPPYFGLRSYTDGGEHYAGQIGSEGTSGEWLASMLTCTREMIRVLKPTGSLFVNLGDKYAGAQNQRSRQETKPYYRGKPLRDRNVPAVIAGVRDKCLMGLPWRYALAATDQLGLILRAEIIWAKPNGLPESVTDRVRRAHEQVFHFTLQPRYYSAVDEIREAHARIWDTAKSNGRTGHGRGTGAMLARPDNPNGGMATTEPNPLGKLPGSVWNIPSQPLTVPPQLGVDHFAAFPMELPRRIIQGWSPPGICTACGEGRRPVSEVGYIRRQHDHIDTRIARNKGNNRNDGALPFGSSALRETTITGYLCDCTQPTAPTRPAVVLDPFGGTGTTALLASTHGRTGISVDRSADYSRLAAWRTTDPAQRAAALQVNKPPAEVTGQEQLMFGT